MPKLNTGVAILQICTAFKKQSVSPIKAYKEIKWGFKTLHDAPHVFNNVTTITLTEHNLVIDMKETSVKKLIKILSKHHYNYYKIEMDNGAYSESYANGNRAYNSDTIPNTVLDLLHLFSAD